LKRFYAALLIAMFVIALWLPIIQMVTRFIEEPPNTENRPLAAFPLFKSLSYTGIREFKRGFDTYFNDNLGFRRLFIQWNSLLKVKILKMSSIESVIIGRDGWLFYNDPKDGINIKDFWGEASFSDAQLKTIKTNLEQINELLSKKGILFLVIIVPNKQTIYPEYLPEKFQDKAGISRIDQLVPYLKQNSNISFLDIRAELSRNKVIYPVYQKTDTHWTSFGTFLTYTAIIEKVSTRFNNVRVLTMRDISIEKTTTVGRGDLAGMLCLPGFFEENVIDVRPRDGFKARDLPENYSHKFSEGIEFREMPGIKAPRLLIFGDSFALELVKFLSESFSKTLLIRTRVIDYDVINKEQPDVVIFEICERYTQELIKLNKINFDTRS
jgi:hypothetical protein